MTCATASASKEAAAWVSARPRQASVPSLRWRVPLPGSHRRGGGAPDTDPDLYLCRPSIYVHVHDLPLTMRPRGSSHSAKREAGREREGELWLHSAGRRKTEPSKREKRDRDGRVKRGQCSPVPGAGWSSDPTRDTGQPQGSPEESRRVSETPPGTLGSPGGKAGQSSDLTRDTGQPRGSGVPSLALPLPLVPPHQRVSSELPGMGTEGLGRKLLAQRCLILPTAPGVHLGPVRVSTRSLQGTAARLTP